MFIAVKSKILKMLRTVPTFWITYLNRSCYCWIPKTGYQNKIKNLAQPPNETDVEGRKEWHFAECEILFEKIFPRFNDAEYELAQLNYDPEWYYNYAKDVLSNESIQSNKLCSATEGVLPSNFVADNSQLPAKVSIVPPDLLLNEPSTSAEVGEMQVHQLCPSLSSNYSASTLTVERTEDRVADNFQLEYNIPIIPPDVLLNELGVPSTSAEEEEIQIHQLGAALSSNNSESTLTVERTEDRVADNFQLLLDKEIQIHQLGAAISSNNSESTLTVEKTEDRVADNFQLEYNIPIIPPDLLLNELDKPSTSAEEEEIQIHQLGATTVERTADCVADKSQLPSNVSIIPPDLSINELGKPSTSSESKNNILSDKEKYEENKRLCELHNFTLPIHYKIFEKRLWRYITTFNANDLQPGNKFMTLEELSLIPRKYKVPFCRPGPLKRDELYDWYLVDSLVQEVHLNDYMQPFFVVRWTGYEDEYNTVEPFSNVKDTAVYKLFTSPDLCTASRLNGCIIKKSDRKIFQKVTVRLQVMDIDLSIFERTMNKLIAELRIEEEADRYYPEIGFCSYESAAEALLNQHRFLLNVFVPLINGLHSSVFVDSHYIGQTMGNLQSANEFKEIAKWGVENMNSIKSYIQNGLREAKKSKPFGPHYVSFLVPRKHSTNEKKDEKHLNLHMCTYTVRSHEDSKDAIYYDPSPACYKHNVPMCLENLKTPVMQSFTYKFGVASDKDDCVFESMCYLIKLATNEATFEPNPLQPCRRIDRYIESAKKRKRK